VIVAVCSLSGSPGVTTLAASLAASWPVSALTVPVLVEADASGGDMGVWHRRRGERGLGSLAAASRHPQTGQGDNPLLAHAEETSGGLPVVMAEPVANQCAAALHQLAQSPWLLRSGGVAVVDVGRIGPRTVGAYLLWQADAVMVAVREDAAHLARLAQFTSSLGRLEESGVRFGAALVGGTRRFSDREIAEHTGMAVWARVPHDARSAAFVRGEPISSGWQWWVRTCAWMRERRDISPVERLPLMRTARGLGERVEALGKRVPAPAPAPEQPVSAPAEQQKAAPAPHAPVALAPQRTSAPSPVDEHRRAA